MCNPCSFSLFEKIKILENLASIEVNRRGPCDWYADLECVEMKEYIRSGILCGFFANGRTPDEAIKNLFDLICETPAEAVFIKNAYGGKDCKRQAFQFRNLTWIPIDEGAK